MNTIKDTFTVIIQFPNFSTEQDRTVILDRINREVLADKFFQGCRAVCPHLHVKLSRTLWRRETMYEPAEYLYHGTCKDCGKEMDGDDIPEEAEVEQ